MADNPMDTVKALLLRLQEEAEKIGLTMEHAAIMPSLGDGPNILQAVFLLKPEAVEEPVPDDAALSADELDVFAQIEQGFKMDERAEKQADIRGDIAKWLNE